MRINKFTLGIILLLISAFMSVNINADNIQSSRVIYNNKSANVTLLQFSSLPCYYNVPRLMNVEGLRLGFPVSYGGDTIVNGVDWALFYSESNNVNGLQISLANWGNNGKGVQLGAVNFAKDSKNFQIGIFNEGDSRSFCIQFGLINKLDNGIVPVFPLINFTI